LNPRQNDTKHRFDAHSFAVYPIDVFFLSNGRVEQLRKIPAKWLNWHHGFVVKNVIWFDVLHDSCNQMNSYAFMVIDIFDTLIFRTWWMQ
jgi:hypothetical protein